MSEQENAVEVRPARDIEMLKMVLGDYYEGEKRAALCVLMDEENGLRRVCVMGEGKTTDILVAAANAVGTTLRYRVKKRKKRYKAAESFVKAVLHFMNEESQGVAETWEEATEDG